MATSTRGGGKKAVKATARRHTRSATSPAREVADAGSKAG